MTTRFQNWVKCLTSLFTIDIFRESSMVVILAMMPSMRQAKTLRVMETKSCTTIGMPWPLPSDTEVSVWGCVCATFHSNWLGLAHLKSRTSSVSNSLNIPSGWLAALSAIVAGREWEWNLNFIHNICVGIYRHAQWKRTFCPFMKQNADFQEGISQA